MSLWLWLFFQLWLYWDSDCVVTSLIMTVYGYQVFQSWHIKSVSPYLQGVPVHAHWVFQSLSIESHNDDDTAWPVATVSPPARAGWIIIPLHCTSLHCNKLHCTALHCTSLHYTALPFTALQHCTVQKCPQVPGQEPWVGPSCIHHTVRLDSTIMYCIVMYCTIYTKTYTWPCNVLHPYSWFSTL